MNIIQYENSHYIGQKNMYIHKLIKNYPQIQLVTDFCCLLLRSARQVIDKASDFACKHKYYEGISTNGFLEYYTNMMSSDDSSITEW